MSRHDKPHVSPAPIDSSKWADLAADGRPIGGTFDLRFTPSHEDGSRVRQEARRRLDDAGLPPALAADVEVIIAELATNAVERRPTGWVELAVVIVEGTICVSVANRTSDAPLDFSLAASGSDGGVLADHGRGLAIVSALADGVWVHHGGGWTTVSCLKSFDRSSR